MKCIVWLLLLALVSCHSLPKKSSYETQISKIPIEDQQKLEILFHHMMTGDYFACTLFGNKPLTFQEFFKDPWKMSSYSMVCPYYHFYMDEGWKTWVKYQSLFPSQQFIFTKIPSKVGYEFIILINTVAFEKMFDENREVFQQALGPQITVDKIFHDFEEGQKTFSQVLNEHEGLVGLVLGYGKEASLSAYRDLALANQILKKSLHPLAPSCEHDKLLSKGAQTSLKLREKKLSRQSVKWHQFSHIENVLDPYEALNESRQTKDYFHPSWQELIVEILPPNFFCINNSTETQRLRNDYGHAMQVARETFKTKSFLRGFLEHYCKDV